MDTQLNQNNSEEYGKRLASLNLSFGVPDASLTIMLMLNRIEERQQIQSKILFKVLEKIVPEGAGPESYQMNNSDEWLLEALLRIQEDVNLAKNISKK